MGEVRILRYNDEPAFEDDPKLQFRLYYDGPLLSARPDAAGGQRGAKREHKHELRKVFHRQLKAFWESHPFLSTNRGGNDGLGDLSFADDNVPYLWETLAAKHEVCGKRFVPLVCEQFSLLCDLKILILRSDKPGGILQSRDIDNRLKVLFDALKKPADGDELGEVEFTPDEQPMYVLLQDDRLITSVAVETDEVLAPPNAEDSYVRATITVTLQPYHSTWFNSGFG